MMGPTRLHAIAGKRSRLLRLMLAVLVATLLPGIPAGAIANEAYSESELRQLANGKVLVSIHRAESASRGRVEATILINAPVEQVWQVITNCEEVPSFLPRIKSCRILAKGANWEIIRHEVKWMWLMPELYYVFKATYTTNKRIEVSRVYGDLRELHGTWRLTRLDEGHKTIVNYSIFLDLGFFVPQWMVHRSLKRELPQVLTAFREQVMRHKE